MAGLGEYLKNEREKKGITLDEASNITRVRKAYLQSIEDGNLDIQSPVFIRGFLKSYAEFLGLDSTDVIERYNSILNEKKDQAAVNKSFELEPVSPRRIRLVPAVLLLALIAVLYILTTSEQPDTTPAPIQETATVDLPEQKPVLSDTTPAQTTLDIMTTSGHVTTETAPPPAPPEEAAGAVQTPEKTERQHSLMASARELTWLEVTVDSNDPVEVLLREGESARWSAESSIKVVVGNAGGVDLTYNGKMLEGLGPSGKVVTKIFPE